MGLLYQKRREEPKDFRIYRPDGNGGFQPGLNGQEQTLYRLHELISAPKQDWVYFLEGEKDTDRIRDLGFPATTSGSATSWNLEFAKHFHNRLLCVIPDNDEAGRKLAERVCDSCYPFATEIRVVNLPGLSEGQDVSDWLDNDGSKAELLRLLDSTRPYRPEPPLTLSLRCMADIEPEKIEYLWDNKIVADTINSVVSNPGEAKSYLSTFMGAHVTTGRPFPDCPNIPVKKGSVIFFSDEDDPAKIIRPRLDAHKANIKKVYIVESVWKRNKKAGLFDITKHLEALENSLREIADCRMVILDPVTAYLGNTNANNNAEMRAALTPLSTLAAKYKVTVLIINHLNKKQDLSYIYRSLGSMALIALSRSVWAIKRDKDDDEVRIFAPVKTNYSVKATGLRFRIIDSVITFDREPWFGRLDDDLNVKKDSSAEVVEWLKARLHTGAVLSSTLFLEGADFGFTRDQLFNAKKKLNIEATREGFGKDGKWLWRLPEGTLQYE